jgi:hypothetical protein
MKKLFTGFSQRKNWLVSAPRTTLKVSRRSLPLTFRNSPLKW